MKEIVYLEYDKIRYLFTTIGFPHRAFVGKYEGKRLLGIRYDTTFIYTS
jgi:hypothetical protein